MVKGLDLFRDHFRAYTNQYLLIGGTACYVVMAEAGLESRATKDLDIVLCIEALDNAFVEAFWTFIRDGKYQLQAESTGEKQYYRFQRPKNDSYPFMLELFSREPDPLSAAHHGHLTSKSRRDLKGHALVSSFSAIRCHRAYSRSLSEN